MGYGDGINGWDCVGMVVVEMEGVGYIGIPNNEFEDWPSVSLVSIVAVDMFQSLLSVYKKNIDKIIRTPFDYIINLGL